MPKYQISINNPNSTNGFIDAVKAVRYETRPSTRDNSIRKEKELMRWERIFENLNLYSNFKTSGIPNNDGSTIPGSADDMKSNFDFEMETQGSYDFELMYLNTHYVGENAVKLIVALSLVQESTKMREIYNPTFVEGLNEVPFGPEVTQVTSEALKENVEDILPFITITEI